MKRPTTRYGSTAYMTSSIGTLLFYIAANPGCAIRDMERDLCLTPRTLWSLIGALKECGAIRHERRRDRLYRYYVVPSAEFIHPTIKGVAIGHILRAVRPKETVPA